MRITSWNVNSMRSRSDLVTEYLATAGPDVLVLQETKCQDGQFPWAVFSDVGYEVAHHGNGPNGGVAIASRVGLERVQYGFAGQHGPPFDEPRLIVADCHDVRVANVYVPNGRTAGSRHWRYKLAWLELLRIEVGLELTDEPNLVVMGDFNVCPTPADLYQPNKRNRNLVTDEERAAIAALLAVGITDLARAARPDEPGYTWFSFSPGKFEAALGYRLDLALGAKAIVDRLEDCAPELEWRDPTRSPSDHAPLKLSLAALASGDAVA